MASTSSETTNKNHYDLYRCVWSLCSTMTRYAFAVRQSPKPGADDIVLTEHEVDIVDKLHQLDEKYLLEINPKGQVSCLSLIEASSPILTFGLLGPCLGQSQRPSKATY
jgi:hypothetical protein